MINFDAVIIGGGPAGASCALWLKMLGFEPCIVERRTTLGGLQAESPYPNDWIVSILGKTGKDVAADMHQHILSHGIACRLGQTVVDARINGQGFQVTTEDAEVVSGKTLVLASGVRPVTGGLSAGKNVLIGPGDQVAAQDFASKRVAILGGGDNAFENYLFIRGKGAAEVHIFARSIRARRSLADRVPAGDVQLGPYEVSSDQVMVGTRTYDLLVVLYGWEAYLPFIHVPELERDRRGFVVTDQNCETTVTGLYAIGEVAQRMHPCCVTAMADGIVAAKDIQRRIDSGGHRTDWRLPYEVLPQ